jgi:hypothetical protein
MDKLKLIIKERWKWYLIGGLFGYIVPILTYGVPSWGYLFPIRYVTVGSAIIIGNSINASLKKYTMFEGLLTSIKSTLLTLFILLVMYLFKLFVLRTFNFDISSYIIISS